MLAFVCGAEQPRADGREVLALPAGGEPIVWQAVVIVLAPAQGSDT